MKLIFVRHAESVGNAEGRFQGRAEYPLTEEGITQAQKLHDRFQSENLQPTHVYSSPQRRTAETAKIASASWPLAIEHWDDLMEHDVGIFSDLTWQEVTEKHPDTAKVFQETRDWNLVEGAETFQERSARAQRVVDVVLERHGGDDTILLFSHGGILQYILGVLMGTERTWGVPVQNTAIFEFSLNMEHWSADDHHKLNNAHWRIHRFNDDSHIF